MRKPVILLIILSFLLTACSKNTEKVSLDQLPDTYSLEEAKSDDCVTFENGDITHGQQVWDDFVKAAKKGKQKSARLAFYYTLDDPSRYSKEYYEEIKDDYPLLFIKDLRFDGKEYTIEGFEDGQLITKKYKYMLKYEGQPRSPSAIFSEYTYYVLVNDDTVTWEDIEDGMLSSQSGAAIDHYKVFTDLVFK